MNARALWLVLAVASPVLAFPANKVVQGPRLLEAADSYLGLVTPSAAPAQEVHLLDNLQLSHDASLPVPVPQDDGGGAGSAVRSDMLPILALVVSLLVGFGIGHLIVRDQNGFVLWLLVDVIIIAATSVLHGFGFWYLGYGGVGSLLLLVSHVIQALDVYAKGGGGKLVEMARERSILVSSAARPEPALPGAVRLLAASF
jgi:hypothetical protein